MRGRAVLIAMLLVTVMSGQSVAQLQSAKPCTLRILLAYDKDTDTSRDITVELMDAVGGGSTLNRKQVMGADRVDFNTLTGTHRVRISGTGIEEYTGEVEITPSETFHVERIRLRVKPGGEDRATVAGEARPTVPAVRLKIPPKAQKEFEKGSKALKDQNWAESKRHFEAAVSAYPDYDMAYNGLGAVAIGTNDDAAAKSAFEKAIELNPKFAEAQRNMARLLLKQKDYQDAVTMLDRSLEVENTNMWALTNAAFAELQLHHFERAVERTQQADKFPHTGTSGADIHLISAYAYEGLQKPIEALAQYRLYLSEDPHGPNAARAQQSVARLSKGAN